jgi:hypothetical protein
MRRLLTTVVAGGLLLSAGFVLADEHEGEMHDGEMEQANVARPVEMYACTYKEGKGPADYDVAVKKFNAWADKQGITDYWAWTMTPYYFGSEQEFDLLWLGAAPNATTLGKIQDAWLATGGKALESFMEVVSCDTHANYAALQFKAAPERQDRSRAVVSFADCNLMNGMMFGDMYPALMEWSKYLSEHNSTAGMWMFFPAYGGGGEGFDMKMVQSWQNLEELGADYDQYAEAGWEKAGELFDGKLDCDASRAYISTTRRIPKGDDE